MKRSLILLAAAGLLASPALALAGKTDNLFTVEAKATPDKLAPRAKGTAVIEIKVKPAGHISDEAPFKGTLTAKNAQVAKDKIVKADAVYKDRGATVTLPFTAGADKGEAVIEASLKFYICSEEICEPHENKVKIPLTVQ